MKIVLILSFTLVSIGSLILGMAVYDVAIRAYWQWYKFHEYGGGNITMDIDSVRMGLVVIPVYFLFSLPIAWLLKRNNWSTYLILSPVIISTLSTVVFFALVASPLVTLVQR